MPPDIGLTGLPTRATLTSRGEHTERGELLRGWTEPVALPSPINTNEYDEDQPFITPDGNELWFTGQSRLGYTGPAIFRCKNVNGSWGAPEEIISNFAGEPTLDSNGNIYFVHHFFSEERDMIEADIYVAYKK